VREAGAYETGIEEMRRNQNTNSNNTNSNDEKGQGLSIGEQGLSLGELHRNGLGELHRNPYFSHFARSHELYKRFFGNPTKGSLVTTASATFARFRRAIITIINDRIAEFRQLRSLKTALLPKVRAGIPVGEVSGNEYSIQIIVCTLYLDFEVIK
jgi:hypothetical protein